MRSKNLRISLRKRQKRQERCARGDAWRMAKNFPKLNEKNNATFSSPTEAWCLQAPSVIKQEERELVVDSGASMHILNRKNLNSADFENSARFQKPYNGHYRRWRGAHKRRRNSVCQRNGFVTVQLLSLSQDSESSTSPAITPSQSTSDVEHWETSFENHQQPKTQ